MMYLLRREEKSLLLCVGNKDGYGCTKHPNLVGLIEAEQ